MDRRRFLQSTATLPFLQTTWPEMIKPAQAEAAIRRSSRIRPSDPGWPSEANWDELNREVGGRLTKVESPLTACLDVPSRDGCAQLFKALKNPYYLGDEVGLTQTLGWVDAWTSRPSIYAVAAQTTEDVAAAVNFARANNLRLVEAIEAAKDTAIHPAVLDAFALLISAAEGPPAYPGIAGHETDLTTARRQAEAIDRAMSEVRKILPGISSYVAESNFFEEAWQEAFWGSNYARLLAVRDKYDPGGLFFVHHGVGSEPWSADGFTPLARQ